MSTIAIDWLKADRPFHGPFTAVYFGAAHIPYWREAEDAWRPSAAMKSVETTVVVGPPKRSYERAFWPLNSLEVLSLLETSDRTGR